MQYHKYSLTEIENMMPWERDIYVGLLRLHLEEEELKRNQEKAMPSTKPNMIDALRAKHDPHYQLAGKVERLEKDIPIQLAQIHKTLK